MPNVLVVHSSGSTFITRRTRAQAAVESGIAYWSDPAKTKLIMLKSTDDQRANDYEYGGRKSYDRRRSVRACDVRTRAEVDVPVEFIDRTGTPVREPGGAKVLQLKPLVDRRSSYPEITRNEDRLYRPPRDMGRRDDTPARVRELRSGQR